MCKSEPPANLCYAETCFVTHCGLLFSVPRSGAQSLTLSKIVPHICNLLGDPNSQVSFWWESLLKVMLITLSVNALQSGWWISWLCCWWWTPKNGVLKEPLADFEEVIFDVCLNQHISYSEFNRTTWICKWDEQKTFVESELICLNSTNAREVAGFLVLDGALFAFRGAAVWAGRAKGTHQAAWPELIRHYQKL